MQPVGAVITHFHPLTPVTAQYSRVGPLLGAVSVRVGLTQVEIRFPVQNPVRQVLADSARVDDAVTTSETRITCDTACSSSKALERSGPVQ